ncbi:MAG: 1-acyl-sn-glycerol-3-phosphate acyltransferase, partial [Rickettsiales bacterium]|nr:1-acyl-sn-glycerol-3-phosphate acyltransferase [Rickettsiales bacterium]
MEKNMYNILKAFLRAVFDAAFRTKKIGAAKLRKIGRRAIFLVPHISSIDPLLLMAYMPGRPIFAMSKASYKWYVRLFLRWTDVFIIDSSNPMSVKSLISEIKKDRQAVVFVEGRLNESGMIAKMYEAPGFVAENANAPIIPVRINGVQHTFFSSLENAARRPFPRVTLTFLDPHKVPPSKYNREQRAKVGDYFYRIMQDTFYQTQIDRNSSIFAAAVDAAKLYGRRRFRRVDIMEDTDRVPHTYGDVLTRSFVLAAGINKITKPDEAVGVMLPNSVANMCAILGLSAYDRVPAMLNFAAGEHAVTDCIDTAAVQTVITSRRFVAALGLGGLVEALLKHKVDVAYAEDIESSATIFDTIAARLKYIFRHVPSPAGGKNKKAVILF